MRSQNDFSKTSGVLALSNLRAQIEGLQARADAGLCSVEEQASLLELVALRGLILGQIADYQWSEEHAERLVREFPSEGMAFLARARTRGTLHRFSDAFADLDEAERLGTPRETVNGERGGMFQAIGEYHLAFPLLHEATERRKNFTSLAALAAFHSDLVLIESAEQLFDEARNAYRGVSPIPLAMLDFQRGHMWMVKGDLGAATIWFQSAVRRVPDFAPAQGHLAEVEMELGEMKSALERLRSLTRKSDDPEYFAALSRVLSRIGKIEEADEWRARAALRFEELTTRHLDAFADHAAAFWLESGNLRRAFALAKRNLEVRATPQAKKLFTYVTRALSGETSTNSRCQH